MVFDFVKKKIKEYRKKKKQERIKKLQEKRLKKSMLLIADMEKVMEHDKFLSSRNEIER